MIEIKELVNISKYAGERFDLVQAGGGNSSVKFDNGEMLIKASGFSLSEVSIDSGYSKVLTKEIANIVTDQTIINSKDKREREELTSEIVKKATIDKKNRPSIETLLHSFLLKYTLHTHPIVINMIVIQENWKEILSSIFKKEDIVLVEYNTPGIELALTLNKELQKFETTPNIIFLQNHGLIVTAEKEKEIYEITEYILKQIENYLQINLSKYKNTNAITQLLKSIKTNNNISYLCEDYYLNQQLIENRALFTKTPFCPDSLVYCGVSCAMIESLSDSKTIESYKNQYHELPKVIIFKNNIFFIGQNTKKAKELEEIFKFHIMVLSQNSNNINYLDFDELAYLSNWEAEKYRQTI
ncbi:MAG: class II aldolase/adducin family protein [Campylobacterales bacterium]|nr:class II aldolase/adducin family protein [Campylobacterales bacterium]